MDKKNYFSREEQEIWEYIKDKEIIDSELIRQVFPDVSEGKKDKILHSLYKKGHLRRAIKGLYYNPLNLKDFYRIALRIHEGYVGLGSALRYHNLIEYEDFTLFILTKNYRRRVVLEGTEYEIKFLPFRNYCCGVEKREGITISSVEKTFFDCFLKPSLVGYTSITKATYDAKIDWNKFIDFFKLSDNSALYQRTGYILELMKKETKMKIPDFVLEFLSKNIKNPVKLITGGENSTFNSKWKIQDNVGVRNILSWWY